MEFYCPLFPQHTYSVSECSTEHYACVIVIRDFTVHGRACSTEDCSTESSYIEVLYKIVVQKIALWEILI